VLEKHCVSCHRPRTAGAHFDLTPAQAYQSLVNFGNPSLSAHVRARYQEGRSLPGAGAANTNPLIPLLDKGHHQVRLGPQDWNRLISWMDCYGQRLGSFDQAQEEELHDLRRRMGALLDQ
jgi:hypothetical protein